MNSMFCLLFVYSITATKWIAIGDWGGGSDSSPTTSGQKDDAAGMQKIAESMGGIDFVMAMGDNFYSSGISGDDHSKRFSQTFEQVYTGSELQCDWYVVAGNHDHRGNVSAQISYSNDSERWTFPDYYYTFSKTSNGVTTQIVYIDTVTFAGMRYKDEATGELVHQTHEMESYFASQLTWLEDTLKTSNADYLWVSGHYPMYSQCEHGPTSVLIKEVLPLMKKYKASGYLAGHDHCLGHYEDDDMVFVLSGAGKECCYKPSNLNNRANTATLKFRMDRDETHGARAGFTAFEADSSKTTIKYYDQDAKLLYTAGEVLPRA